MLSLHYLRVQIYDISRYCDTHKFREITFLHDFGYVLIYLTLNSTKNVQ